MLGKIKLFKTLGEMDGWTTCGQRGGPGWTSVVFVSLKIPLQQPVIGSQDVDWGCLALGGVCPGGMGRIGVIRLESGGA